MKKKHEYVFSSNGKWRKILLIMKLKLFILLCCIQTVNATAFCQEQKLDVVFDNELIVTVFDYLQNQTGLQFFYLDKSVSASDRVSVSMKQATLPEVLDNILKDRGYTYELLEGVVIIKPVVQSDEPERKTIRLKGFVYDTKKQPLAGVTVKVSDLALGTSTNAKGWFALELPMTKGTLEFSFIGFKRETINFFERTAKDTLRITLKEDSQVLDETVVVAFGTQKKESVVASITTVDPKALKSSSSDLTSQFAGKIPGMIAWQTGGIPGALTEEEMNVKFYIRGITSFQSGANIDPLILIDGVESSKLDLARIAPEDIETFSVMKDASATAMYGARGANGVILIATKKGEEGSVYTSVRYEAISSIPTRKIDVVDPVTYMKMYNQALLARNPNATPQYSVERIERTGNPDYPSFVYPTNDWYNILFKDVSVNHHMGVNIRGGSKVIQYYASVNYSRDEGMLKTDRLNQFDCNITNNTFSFRTNLNIDLAAGIRLLVTSSASLDKYHGPFKDVKEAYGMAFAASPVDFAPLYPGDAAYAWPHLRFGGVNEKSVNPYMSIQQGYTDRKRYSSSTRAEYIQNLSSIVKGLEARASMSLNKTGYYNTPLSTNPFMYSLDDYDFETGKHVLYALNSERATRTLKPSGGGGSQSTQVNYEVRALHVAGWEEHQTSLTAVFGMQEVTTSAAQSVFDAMPQRNMTFSMRGTYGFKDRYFAEASFGYNGSERFARDHQWGLFPAVGGAWIASKENFLAGTSNWLSFLKLRLSWGKVGNDGVIKKPRFTHLPEIGEQQFSDPRPGKAQDYRYRVIAYPNSKIKWEIAEQSNFGIETKFFGGLFEMTADIYQEIRHNIIGHRITIPATIGLEEFQLANVGKARSHGIDLSGKIQHAFSNDFWVILNGTFTYNKAVYKEIEEAPDKPTWQMKKNHEISQSVGYIAEGLFRDQAEIANSPKQGGEVMPGDIRYRDLNGDGVIDVSDATYIGFPETPRMIYGFSGFISYKNFEFNFAFQGSGKRTFFMNPMQINPFVGDRAMLTEIYKDHWSEDNMKERPFWPRLSTQSIAMHNPQEDWGAEKEMRKSTYFMRECRFLRCTAIELGYNMPQRLITKLKLQNVRFYARVNNPFLISNFKVWDVELGNSGFNYPIQRTFSAGLSFSF